MPINFGIPPWGVRCKETQSGWVVSASTRSCLVFPLLGFMGFWSYLAFGWMFSSKFSLAQFTPASAAVVISLFIGGLFFWWVALMGVLGKVEVRLDGDDGRIFTGFGPFGWTQRFKRSEITSVGEFTRTDEPDIIIQGKKRIRFGSWLSTSRRRYMVEVLSRLLLDDLNF